MLQTYLLVKKIESNSQQGNSTIDKELTTLHIEKGVLPPTDILTKFTDIKSLYDSKQL